MGNRVRRWQKLQVAVLLLGDRTGNSFIHSPPFRGVSSHPNKAQLAPAQDTMTGLRVANGFEGMHDLIYRFDFAPCEQNSSRSAGLTAVVKVMLAEGCSGHQESKRRKKVLKAGHHLALGQETSGYGGVAHTAGYLGGGSAMTSAKTTPLITHPRARRLSYVPGQRVWPNSHARIRKS
jgi:hypothetical protein